MPMVLLSTALGMAVANLVNVVLYLETTMKTLVKLQIRRAVFVAAETTLPHHRHLQIPPFHLLLLRRLVALPS